MITDPAILHRYREAIEQAYCASLINLIPSVPAFNDRQLATFANQGLSWQSQAALDDQLASYGLDAGEANAKQREVCQSMLSYLRIALFIQNLNSLPEGRPILESVRLRLELTQTTAEAINQAVFPSLALSQPAWSQSELESYDLTLYQALHRDRHLFNSDDCNSTPLTQASQAELQQLQSLFKIPNHEIPPANRLWTDRGTDYIQLWRKLKQQDWRGANEETLNLMRSRSGKAERDPEELDLQGLPLVDLRTIDLLWSEASGGRFGFLAQLKIWRETSLAPSQPAEAFGDRVDWRRNGTWISYKFMDFSLDAARGHLPTFPQIGWWCWARHKLLMQRIAMLQPIDLLPLSSHLSAFVISGLSLGWLKLALG